MVVVTVRFIKRKEHPMLTILLAILSCPVFWSNGGALVDYVSEPISFVCDGSVLTNIKKYEITLD